MPSICSDWVFFRVIIKQWWHDDTVYTVWTFRTAQFINHCFQFQNIALFWDCFCCIDFLLINFNGLRNKRQTEFNLKLHSARNVNVWIQHTQAWAIKKFQTITINNKICFYIDSPSGVSFILFFKSFFMDFKTLLFISVVHGKCVHFANESLYHRYSRRRRGQEIQSFERKKVKTSSPVVLIARWKCYTKNEQMTPYNGSHAHITNWLLQTFYDVLFKVHKITRRMMEMCISNSVASLIDSQISNNWTESNVMCCTWLWIRKKTLNNMRNKIIIVSLAALQTRDRW